jgi:predicted amidohydrolase
VKITFVTERPVVGDQPKNLATIASHLESAAGDLVVFGELFAPGYMARDGHSSLGLDLKGPEIGHLKDVAKSAGKSVVFGFTRADAAARGVVYDSMALITRRGRVDYYDKWYLASFGPFEEKLFFGQGSRLKVWDVDGVKIGPQICYDIFFPEITKAYALMGADLLLNISASPNVSRTFFEALFPARAIETGCFFAYANVAGTQEDLVFWGGSQLWGPRGDLKVKAPYFESSVVDYDFDLAEVAAARPLRPTTRDTRAEMVAAMAKALRAKTR